MNFQELQIKFAKKHLDTRTDWIAGWDDNMEALNDWYKEVYNNAIQDRNIQEIMKSAKTLITITDKEWVMPNDFLQPVNLYFKEWISYFEIDKDEFKYRYIRSWWTYKVIFDIKPNNVIYSEYIPQVTELVDNTDAITLPAEFDWDIINYALIEYHRSNRDWSEVSNELQYAEWKMQRSIDNFWLE